LGRGIHFDFCDDEARRRGNEECMQGLGLQHPKGRDSKEDLEVDGNILLKCPLQKYYGSVHSGFNWLSTGLINGAVLKTATKIPIS
jgi:hypothetical protein